MNHRDAEMADIVVILHDSAAEKFDQAVAELKSHGCMVSDTDADQGVVEGTIESEKVRDLQNLPSVKYVRKVFEYIADFPIGDPRDKDLSEDEADPDPI